MDYTYWCVVALTYDRSDAWVMSQSSDAALDDVFIDNSVFDSFDNSWADGRKPGLYRLTGDFSDQDHDVFIVSEVEQLVEFPPLISTRSADHYETINRRMREIKETEG